MSEEESKMVWLMLVSGFEGCARTSASMEAPVLSPHIASVPGADVRKRGEAL